MKSYIFRVEVEEDEHGTWSAVVPALPGCAVDAGSVSDALDAIQEAAQAYVEVLLEDGRSVPLEVVSSGEDGAAVAIVA